MEIIRLIVNTFLTWVNKTSIEYLLFYLIALLAFIELIVFPTPPSYVCRWGILIRKIPISKAYLDKILDDNQRDKNLSLKINNKRKEVYLWSNYFFIRKCPNFFVAQINNETSSILNVRTGIFSSVLFLSMIIGNIFRDIGSSFNFMDILWSLLNYAILFALIAIYYFRLITDLRLKQYNQRDELF